MFSYQMEQQDEHLNVRQLIGKLHERQQNVPVFLLGDREKATASLDRDLLELVDEFARFWKTPQTLSPGAPLRR